MTLKLLNIEHLRNLSQVSTTLHPHLNIISGENGCGKTSFLEAIYLLSCARSFRTHEIASLVSHGQSNLTIYAKMENDQEVAIQKSLNAATLMRIDNSTCLSASELARALPAQVFYQDIFQIIDAGPSVRRSVLDWGLFHVKHQYYDLWKKYRRALKQRNYLLRQKVSFSEFVPWNKVLSELANEMHLMRTDYLSDLNQQFKQILLGLSEISCTLHYFKGWDKRGENKSLELVLTESLSVDLQYQYTRYGAHQAELLFATGERKLKHYLSRGQQKIVLFALKLAQAKLLNKPCVFLIDDFFAEFDANHIERLIDCISNTSGQFFLTCHESIRVLQSLGSQAMSNIELPFKKKFR